MRILVTGGAGFIGSNLTRLLVAGGHAVTVVDKLTYAGNLSSLADLQSKPGFTFVQADICDAEAMRRTFASTWPEAVMHLAAESHVDRSIDSPEPFFQTNVIGTLRLLNCAKQHWSGLPGARKGAFRFLHVSTDEVYGTLSLTDPAFTEETPFAPNSPYAASKASSDHLVRSFQHTCHFPTLTTNCSNNYGPYQFPEKLIPLMLVNCLHGRPLPIYGDGMNIRDWLHVDDHCRGITLALEKGRPGEVYNIGGNNEWRNLAIVERLCDSLDARFAKDPALAQRFPSAPGASARSARELVTFVEDRAGHDWRYAIDARRITDELGYVPRESFETGLERTLDWFLANEDWWRPLLVG